MESMPNLSSEGDSFDFGDDLGDALGEFGGEVAQIAQDRGKAEVKKRREDKETARMRRMMATGREGW